MYRITVRAAIIAIIVTCVFVLFISFEECTDCFTPEALMIRSFICGILIFISSMYFTNSYKKTEKQLFPIEALPLIETNEATEDVPICIMGTIKEKKDKLLTSPYTKTQCVYYHSIMEEYVSRGKSSKWEIREHTVEYEPFYLVDNRGKLEIDITNIDDDRSGYTLKRFSYEVPDPDKSEIDAKAIIKHEPYFKKSKLLGFIPTSRRHRRSEFVLTPGMRVFIYGQVSRNKNGLYVHESYTHPLIISQKTKDEFIDEFYKGKNLIYLIHLFTALAFTLIAYPIGYFFSMTTIVFYSFLYIGNSIILGSIVLTMYNRIVTLRERALTALSNIDIELKRRADVIPQIVNVVNDYSKYEKSAHELVAKLRVQLAYQDNRPKQAENDLVPLLAIAEKNPKLKASENYRELMKSLIDTEERIAYSRVFYNRNVGKLNTLIQQIPFNLIALFLNIKKMQFISLTTSN